MTLRQLLDRVLWQASFWDEFTIVGFNEAFGFSRLAYGAKRSAANGG
ncbi:MAG: hypothetical protein ABIJ48_05275 [Actinomycetota bacterium]